MIRLGAAALAAALVALATAPIVTAQRTSDVRRVGYLHADADGFPSAFHEAVRAGMRELGYVDGQNLVVERRAGRTRAELTAAALDLIRRNVEVIITAGPATSPARQATSTVPIVFSFSGDPVEAGFVKTLARPGGNMTGVTWLAFDLVGKRLELLKEAAPGISRVAVLSNPAHPGERRELKETEHAARTLGAAFQYLHVKAAADFPPAFDSILNERADALVVLPDNVTMQQRQQITEFALKHRLPSVFGWREYADAGGLMAYGPNRIETGRRVAVYVDRILKGAKPGDLPVELPTRFELTVNLNTAKALGLTLPPSLLLRADHVVR